MIALVVGIVLLVAAGAVATWAVIGDRYARGYDAGFQAALTEGGES